jgi:BASS family bile acid:Na+ symporter
MQQLDKVTINFNNESLWVLNIALAIVMFGVALNITTNESLK